MHALFTKHMVPKLPSTLTTDPNVFHSSQSLKQRQCHGDLCRPRNLFKQLETLPSEHKLPQKQSFFKIFTCIAIQIYIYFCN